MTGPAVCPGRVAINFLDLNGKEDGFDLPCNTVLTSAPETGETVCHNGHRWPTEERVDG